MSILNTLRKTNMKKNIFLMLALTLCSHANASTTTYPLVATGQTLCYNGNGEQIDAPKVGDALYGQDANYLKGAPMSFKDNGDGTVTDLNTGLMWQQTPRDEGASWLDAKKYCEELVLAGHDDWRMPTLKELFSISNFETGWPYIDTTYFKLSANGVSKDEQYWCDNHYVGETSQGRDDAAFGVNHVTGHIKAYPAGSKKPQGEQGGQMGQGGPQGMPQGGQQGGRPQMSGQGQMGQGGQQGMPQGGQQGGRPQMGGQDQMGQGGPQGMPQGGQQGGRPQMGGQGQMGQGGPQGMPQGGQQGGRPQMGGMQGSQSASLSPEQLKDIFTAADKDTDGLLSVEEFQAAAKSLRPKQSGQGQMGQMGQGGPQGMPQGGQQGGQRQMGQGGQQGGEGMMPPPPGGQSGAKRGNPMFKQIRAVRGNAYGINKFVDNNDGTITDEATGLMWQKDDSGKGMTWLAALELAETSTANGYSDWRLPNVKELQSIVDYRYAPSSKGNAPAIDRTFFNCTETVNEAGDADYGYYWTGTSACFQKGKPFYFAWYVAFGRAVNGQGKDTHGAGAVRFDSKTDNGMPVEGGEERYHNYVRLVRDAQAATTESK